MDFFPPNKRTEENFKQIFLEKGLTEIIKLHMAQASQEAKRKLQQTLLDAINEEKPHGEIIADIKEFALKASISEHEIIVIVSTFPFYSIANNNSFLSIPSFARSGSWFSLHSLVDPL